MVGVRLQGLNCLHLAARNGHIDCLRYLLDNYNIGVDETVASSGCTALHLTISTKSSGKIRLRCMKLLLERGADLDKSAECLQMIQLPFISLFTPGRAKMARQHSIWPVGMDTQSV